MVQLLPRFCPRCGTPIVADQRFCATCGLPIDVRSREGNYMPPLRNYQQGPVQIPVADQRMYQPSPQISQVNFRAPAQTPPKRYEQPLKKQKSRKRAPYLIVLLLLLVLALGIAAYVGVVILGYRLPNLGIQNPVQPPVATTSIGVTVPYAGVAITIVNAQQSQSFVDDPNAGGLVRLNLQEQNKTSTLVSWSYNSIARLILPGNVVVTPKYVKSQEGIAPGALQASSVDFAVPSTVKISQLSLQFGATNEAQMNIPLTGKTDESKYQPKTKNLHAQLQYFGLNWNLTGVTESIDVEGQQAAKGMRYFILTLQVDNPLSQSAIVGSAFDYIRLQSGAITAAPKDTTLPISFDAGVTGKTGTVTFLLPEGSTAFTFILLPQSGIDQASTDFQFA